MFCLRKPPTDEVQRFITLQQHSAFSYPEVGASARELPDGYNVDRNRVLLGSGESTWLRSMQSIREWRMFSMPWVRLYWPSMPIEVGRTVAVQVTHFGFCSLNFARIVYTINEDGPVRRCGFAYGTLEEHAERGEERFTVEWDRLKDQVWYNILAFSRPNKALAKLGYPLARMLQKKFAEASKSAMLRAAQGD